MGAKRRAAGESTFIRSIELYEVEVDLLTAESVQYSAKR